MLANLRCLHENCRSKLPLLIPGDAKSMQSEKGMPQPHLGVHLRVKLKILKAVLTVLINHSHPKTGRIGMKFTHGHFHHRHLHS